MELLWKVANVRFGLQIVAELLQQIVTHPIPNTNAHFNDEMCEEKAQKLLVVAKHICAMQQPRREELAIKTLTGPAIFLMKTIVRRFGLSCLKSIMERPELQWVVREDLRGTQVRH